MRNELSVLLNINNDGNTTQRDIAKSTGMSLGSVNILIRRLVSRGLLKIEKVTPRTIRYILTSKGIKEKSEATYNYIINSLKVINNISINVDKLIKNHSNCGYNLILFGTRDELFDYISLKLKAGKHEFAYVNKLVDLEQYLTDAETSKVIIWNQNYIELLPSEKVEVFNLLENL